MDTDREGNLFPLARDGDAWTLLESARHAERQSRVPVWIMRQAGRYLPEYHEVREKAGNDFFKMCSTPPMASEVTLQPLRRFALDAAIIFCDILVVPQALGMDVRMEPGIGPVFPEPLETPKDLERLLAADAIDIKSSLGYALEALTLTRHGLAGKAPLIGFVGAPWTLMAYMIEGRGSKTFSKAKTWLFKYPDASHVLLQRVTDVLVTFLLEQVRAGAQILQVFDSWAGELSSECFQTFSLPYIQQIEERVRSGVAEMLVAAGASSLSAAGPAVPMVLFAKGAHFSIEEIVKSTTYDVLGLDWQTDPEHVVDVCIKHKRSVCLQGNLDPCALYAEKEVVGQLTNAMLLRFHAAIERARNAGVTLTHICNLGHGLHPTHDPEHVKEFINAVHSFSRTRMQK